MLRYIIKRTLVSVPTLIAISVISFVIIQLPPGDFLTTYIAELEAQGAPVSQSEIVALRARYGLDRSFAEQYFFWIRNFLRGDLGFSFQWNRPVSQLIWDRLGLTIAVSFTSMVFAWIIAIPIGIYSAVKQHSFGDHFFTFLGFIGLATPNFMLALLLMFFSHRVLGTSVGGLFSSEFVDAPWSFARVLDLLSHLWIPVIIVGTAGTAGTIRVLRNNLLDELRKAYVETARTKGLAEWKLLIRYPVRVAINPLMSTVGWLLPDMVSGAVITSVVLSLPTTGPLLLSALQSQDMYLAGSFVMLLAFLTVIGTLISDLLLGLVDPRIRREYR